LHNYEGLNQGIGFPTGFSINNCAAHFTPTNGDNIIIKADDVVKVDFGTHINGRIIDSAFTFSFDSKYDQLLQASKEATSTGIKEAGIDVRLGELGGLIQETMESFEIELNGKIYPIKPIRNLGGHNIDSYTIHAGKYVPCIATNDMTKMEEGEVYAIETFATTGSGVVRELEPTSHYMKDPNHQYVDLKFKNYKKALNTINNLYDTLPFCDKWLHNEINNPKDVLDKLADVKILKRYPPLYDIDNSYTSQYEHTIILKPKSKEVLSKSSDY
jgi:methionyl aminopeptidase